MDANLLKQIRDNTREFTNTVRSEIEHTHMRQKEPEQVLASRTRSNSAQTKHEQQAAEGIRHALWCCQSDGLAVQAHRQELALNQCSTRDKRQRVSSFRGARIANHDAKQPKNAIELPSELHNCIVRIQQAECKTQSRELLIVMNRFGTGVRCSCRSCPRACH